MTLTIVTGANRGIGLALTKVFAGRGGQVIAACRTPSAELATLKEKAPGVELVTGFEVTSPEGVARLVAAVGERKVDLLVNNAGILRWGETLEQPSLDTVLEQLQVNAVGPLRVTAALHKNLQRGSKLAYITSRMGSIADNGSGGMYGYRMSKAALNAAAMSVARNLAKEGVAVAILHPGMVSTDMIGGRGDVAPDDAAKNLVQRIDALTLETSGTFWHANGEVLPW